MTRTAAASTAARGGGQYTALEPPAPAEGRPRERLLSLDVFRGLTVAGMLLVNNPGTWSAIYPPLGHAQWHGWTPTDLIFPFFLFIVGITTHLSLTARRERGDDERAMLHQILRRSALIFLLGLFLAWFPGYTWGIVEGTSDPTLLDRILDRWRDMRIPGVLQRIALAYLIAALLALRTTPRTQAIAVAVMLLGYWAVMTLLPVPGSGGVPGYRLLGEPAATMAAYVDRMVLDWGVYGNHLWAATRTWDPEGVLSTIPAAATAVLGVFGGRWIGQARPLSERLNGLFAVGSMAIVAGFAWGWVFPINKGIWTSSYVVFTAGMAAVTLAGCMWVIEVRNVRGWTRPFVIFGMNPIIAFVGAGLMARLIYSVISVNFGGERISLQAAIFRSAYASWLPPHPASLLFAVTFVLVWLAILNVLHRRGLFLKV